MIQLISSQDGPGVTTHKELEIYGGILSTVTTDALVLKHKTIC